MLTDLNIRNFAIIDELDIHFDGGLNILTGETGAGKSIILDAMALVLGERADTTMIRTGEETAYVEASFQLSPKMLNFLEPILVGEGLENEPADMLLLTRELRLSGRNICRINGRAVNLSLQKQLGDRLVDIHGQGQHLSLLRRKSHLPLLDAFAGLDDKRHAVAATVRQLQSIRRKLKAQKENERSLAQRLDLLRYQVNEIDAANLFVGEEEELREERKRQANVEQLLLYANEALMALGGSDDDSISASDLLGKAERTVEQLSSLDPSMEAFSENVESIYFQINDLITELIRYRSKLEYDPARLGYLEERLELINRLRRKYGDDIESILTARQSAQDEIEKITHDEELTERLQKQERALLEELGDEGKILSNKRKQAASKLATAVEKELSELNMVEARFEVNFNEIESEDGAPVGSKVLQFDESGFDQVEFLVSANPGEDLKPLAKVASGGETSRLMLAMKTVLARVDSTPTLIFDEIDQGIGGRIGEIVGQKLWGLTMEAEHQVIIVTHLPQLAGYADGHFRVSKQIKGDRTTTTVVRLDGNPRVLELKDMLGANDQAAAITAESLLRQAEANKKSRKNS
jgi:DNA repair protein RecN (Recombination protein N)